MSEFKREQRYIVIKIKELDLLTDEAKKELENILMALSIAKQPDIDAGAKAEIDCVVVEKDWPIYEKVWQMVEECWLAKNRKRELLESAGTECVPHHC